MTKIEKFINRLPEMFSESKQMCMNDLGWSEKKAEENALLWIKALVQTEIEFIDFKMEKP